MKETTMSFRIEPELRDSFHRAAEQGHRPAAQVLREFMREYVARRLQPPAISDEERERRRAAVVFARSSNALEGFGITEAEEAHAQRFINGEINPAEFLDAAHGPCRQALKD